MRSGRDSSLVGRVVRPEESPALCAGDSSLPDIAEKLETLSDALHLRVLRIVKFGSQHDPHFNMHTSAGTVLLPGVSFVTSHRKFGIAVAAYVGRIVIDKYCRKHWTELAQLILDCAEDVFVLPSGVKYDLQFSLKAFLETCNKIVWQGEEYFRLDDFSDWLFKSRCIRSKFHIAKALRSLGSENRAVPHCDGTRRTSLSVWKVPKSIS